MFKVNNKKQNNVILESLCNKVTELKALNFFKKRLQHDVILLFLLLTLNIFDTFL